MQHLCIKQKALSTEWESERKASTKTCETSEDKKIQASLGRTSPDTCSKPSSTPDDPQGGNLSRENPAELGVYKCSTTPCQNCRKSIEPLAEECQPPKANGPVVCNSASDCYRQAELQHRLKPSTTPPDSAPTSGLVNHINTETVKKEPESTTGACTEKNCPTAPTIWPHSSQQNHKDEMELQECMSSDEKPSYSITSSAHSDTPSPKDSQELDSTRLGSSSPPTQGTFMRQ